MNPSLKTPLSGIALVLAGSASYGLLSTFVKLAYRDSFTTAEITTSQFIWGALVLTALASLTARSGPRATSTDTWRLLLAGTTTGFTSVLYYISVNYIPASVAVVLLMQSIWMGVLAECVLKRRSPTLEEAIAVVLVLFGTLLATDTFATATVHLDGRGALFGLLSAISYSGTLVATGRVAAHLTAVKRSQYMLYGGAVVALAFALLTQIGPHYLGWSLVGPDFARDRAFNPQIFGSYGLIVAIFGTILPPILLNRGFPITGVALGSIISSVELPFAAMVAFLVLGERLNPLQILGILIILGSVFMLNYRLITRSTVKAGP